MTNTAILIDKCTAVALSLVISKGLLKFIGTSPQINLFKNIYMDDFYENFKLETPHNTIDLVCHQGRMELRGKDKSLQSVINLEKPHQLELKNLEYLMSVLLFISAPQSILMLGTAAGSSTAIKSAKAFNTSSEGVCA